MTKAELVNLFKEAAQISKAEAEEYLERLGDIIAAELLGGGEVSLPRVGKLKVNKLAARKARNPKTGETIDVPAKKKAVLVMTKDLKEALKG